MRGTSGFHHVAVQALDVERVADFYREIICLRELRRFQAEDGGLRSVWLALGPDEAAGFVAVERAAVGESTRGPLGFSMVALRIEPDDRPAWRARFEANNVHIERETAWTMYVRDPEGNLVGVSHHPHDAPRGV